MRSTTIFTTYYEQHRGDSCSVMSCKVCQEFFWPCPLSGCALINNKHKNKGIRIKNANHTMLITITSEINPILIYLDNGTLLQCRIGLISEVIARVHNVLLVIVIRGRRIQKSPN